MAETIAFKIPPNLTDLELGKADRLCVQDNVDLREERDASALHDRLDGLRERVLGGGGDGEEDGNGDHEGVTSIANQENFDLMYCFVRDFRHVPGSVQKGVLDTLECVVEGLVQHIEPSPLSQQARRRARGKRRAEDWASVGMKLEGRDTAAEDNGQGQGQGQFPLQVKNAFQIAVFFLFTVTMKAEAVFANTKENESLERQANGRGAGARGGKKKGATGGGAAAGAAAVRELQWETARETALSILVEALRCDRSRLWHLGIPAEDFVNLFLRVGYSVLELPHTMLAGSKPVKLLAFQLVALSFQASQSVTAGVSARILQMVNAHDHLPPAMAELCRGLAKGQHRDSRLAADLLRELGRMDLNHVDAAKNAAGVRNMSKFLEEMSTALPGVVLTNLSVLLPHFQSEPYAIRSALTSCLAGILCAGAEYERREKDKAAGRAVEEDEEEEEKEEGGDGQVKVDTKTRDRLLDILEERVRDVNAFSRSAVLKAWATLSEARAIPRNRIQDVAKIGQDRLHDKSSNVRKSAVQLLTALLENNPYGAVLEPQPYVRKAEEVMAELLKVTGGGEKGPRLTKGEKKALKDADLDIGRFGGEGEEEEEEEEEGGGDESDKENNVKEEEVSEEEEGEEKEDGVKVEPKVEDEDEAEEEEKMSEAERKKMDLTLQLSLLNGAIGFVAVLGAASTTLFTMLQSRTTSDVIEALRFFTKARQFQLPSAAIGIRKSLPLVWHSEASVVEEAKNAFVEAFVSVPGGGPRGPPLQPREVAQNLVMVCAQSSTADLVCLEKLLTTLVEGDDKGQPRLEMKVFDQLWLAVAGKGNPAWARAAALQVVACGAVAAPSLVDDSSRLQTLLATGLGQGVMEAGDWNTVKSACLALQRLDPGTSSALGSSSSSSSSSGNARGSSGWDQDEKRRLVDKILKRLCHFVQGRWCEAPSCPARVNRVSSVSSAVVSDSSSSIEGGEEGDSVDDDADDEDEDEDAEDAAGAAPHEEPTVAAAVGDTAAAQLKEREDAESLTWFAAAEQAIVVIFKLSAKPEVLAGAVVRQMGGVTLQLAEGEGGVAADGGGEGQAQMATTTSPLQLARLCFVVGHVALQLLVYSEELASKIKRARAGGDGKAAGGGGGEGGGGRAKVSEAPKGVQRKGKKVVVEEEEEEEEGGKDEELESDMGANQEQEAEDERQILDVTEKEIVGRNLLGLFGPLLVRIVANEEGHFAHPVLRESAVLALCKFMCISGEFCERYLALLFTTLEAPEEGMAVRANIVIALGDLAFRFPNALEPWSHYIYSRLRDPNTLVRANTMLVLTHLILNDMVKVKGLVSDIALCLVDPVPRIRGMARMFFHSLSKRGTNPIYNLLPDVVGRLSTGDVEEDDFKEVMAFLLSKIDKDKQTESLVEKLCHRIQAAETPKGQRDMAYCLGQLKVTEKAVKRLCELLPTYKGALGDEQVFSSFQLLVGRAKKFAKPDMKEAVQEWDALLQAHHEGGAEDEDAAQRAKKASKRARRAKGTTKGKGGEEGRDMAKDRKALKRVTRGGGRKKPAAAVVAEYEGESEEEEESEEDEEDDDEEEEEEKAPRGKVKGKRAVRRVAESSGEEDGEESDGDEDNIFSQSSRSSSNNNNKENAVKNGSRSRRGARR